MIREIFSLGLHDSIKPHLAAMGFMGNIESASNPLKPYYLLCLDTGEVVPLSKAMIQNYRYYKVDHRTQVFICKKNENATSLKKVHTLLEKQKKNLIAFSKNIQLLELEQFINTFNNLDLDSLTQAIFACEGFDKDKDCYFVFDYKDTFIQKESFFQNLANALEKSLDEGPEDALGNLGEPVPCSLKITTSTGKKEQLLLYSKNSNNACYTRYGITGGEAFPIGKKSLNLLKQILLFALENGILTSYEEIIGQKKKKEYKILGSFGGKDPNFLLKNSDIDTVTKECKATIDAIKNLRVYQGFSSMVVFGKNGHSPCNIVSSHTTSHEKICKLISQWQTGICQTPLSKLPPGVFQPEFALNIPIITKFLRKQATLSSGTVRITNNFQWKICDSIDLFFGDTKTDKAIKLLAKNAPYFSRKAQETRNKKTPKFDKFSIISDYNYFNYFLPVAGLILYKKGISMEDTEKTWAYKLGQIFSLAAEIEKSYFWSTKKGCPSQLHAERALVLAFQNPQKGFASLLKSLNVPYLAWAERKLYLSSQKWKELIENLGPVPTKATDVEKIQMSTGKASNMTYNALKANNALKAKTVLDSAG